ncbi:hypothetical protein [Sulfurimonas sp. HSL-1716]|uniref:hypothetical protein n=1 Tax=Hydrocurvibacter sulfurireducens TaxID=3131937 RepID=UPI0031F8E9AB
MYKIFKLLSTLIVALFISGCSALVSTRSLPSTTLPNKNLHVNKKILAIPVYFKGFELNSDNIELKHYEGILQAEQFWIASPSDEQKLQLKESAITLINAGFVRELKAQGLDIENIDAAKPDDPEGFKLTGKINRIVIKTYGAGFGGFGSAGDYWECYLYLDKIEMTSFDGTQTYLLDKPATIYAKLNGSPIKLGSFLEGFIWMAKLADNPFTSLPQYYMNNIVHSPVEVAGRISARMFLQKLNDNIIK